MRGLVSDTIRHMKEFRPSNVGQCIVTRVKVALCSLMKEKKLDWDDFYDNEDLYNELLDLATRKTHYRMRNAGRSYFNLNNGDISPAEHQKIADGKYKSQKFKMREVWNDRVDVDDQEIE